MTNGSGDSIKGAAIIIIAATVGGILALAGLVSALIWASHHLLWTA